MRRRILGSAVALPPKARPTSYKQSYEAGPLALAPPLGGPPKPPDLSRRLGRGLDGFERRGEALLRVPEIVSGLHVEIELRLAAREPAETQRHVGGNGAR